MKYLARRYRIVPLAQLVDAIRRRDWSAMPSKSLVVTFDDGHRGNYDLLPIFRKYAVRPTIYLVSRVVATHRHFWFRDLTLAETGRLKRKPNHRRLALLDEEYGFNQTREYPAEERQALSAAEIKEMAPWVDFQAHTCFHPILPGCTDEECRWEVETCRRDLEQLLGHSVEHFSYPNGDHGEREIALAREAGFQSARTVDVGWNDLRTDPFRLRITGVTDDASINMLAAQLTGLTMYVSYRKRGGKGGRCPTTPVEQEAP